MPSAVYAHGAGSDEALLRLTGSTSSPSATQAAYLQDGLGSVVGTVNGAGALISSQRFDAWGNRGTTTGTTPIYGFTGREPDATGLTYFRARYQHPWIGRFLSRDPAGMADAVSPYAYVRNNPVGLIDPFGLSALDPEQLQQLISSGSSLDLSTGTQLAGNGNIRGICVFPIGCAPGPAGPGSQSLNGAQSSSTGDRALDEALPNGASSTNLVDKMATEIGGIIQRNLGPEGEVYSLRATQSGDYPNVRGGTTHLEAGDVYKYGETTQDSRYPRKELERAGLTYKTEFEGSQTMAKIVEKLRIYGHVLENGELPPGNRIFR